MNYEMLIFEGCSALVECLIFFFTIVTMFDFMRTMIFSDK